MHGALIGIIAALLTSCASMQRPWLHPYRPTSTIGGQTYCAKHHIPTISIIGYHSIQSQEKIVLVHDWDPQALKCNPDNPNRLADDSKFHRTSIHSVRGIITFCPLCDADYWHCRGGDHQLSDADVQQITALVTRYPEFRRPILRIFAVYSPNAVAMGGRQERVGDIFTDIGLAKRGDRWVVAYPVSSHRVVAIGRDDL
jgi:hypothetical protein